MEKNILKILKILNIKEFFGSVFKINFVINILKITLNNFKFQ